LSRELCSDEEELGVPGHRTLGLYLLRATPEIAEQESRQSNSKAVVTIPAHDEAASTAADHAAVAPDRGKSISKLF
jgi:hypothetical protein